MPRGSTYFQYAAKLNQSSFGSIIAFAEAYNFHLAQEFDSIMRLEAGMELYVNMIFDVTRGEPSEFSVFPGATFDACWHRGDGMRGPFFRIHKNKD